MLYVIYWRMIVSNVFAISDNVAMDLQDVPWLGVFVGFSYWDD